MRLFRSLLFVPGHRPTWVDKAIAAGADAVVLDLEDAVPPDYKHEARRAVAAAISRIDNNPDIRVGVIVRPNPLETDLFGGDLEAVVVPGLEALLLPKVYSREDIYRFDGLLTHLELKAGMKRGTVQLIPSLETAKSVALAADLAASPRVASLQSATARDGDIAREVGYSWSAEGLETLYMRSRAVLACRAAGLTHPLCGVWQDIHDLDGLRDFSAQNRKLGFRGQLILHPSHVSDVNLQYSVSAAESDRARRMIDCYNEGIRAGKSAVLFEGEHIDTAHIKTAQELLDLASRQESIK